jgi:hypothetical protein
LRQNLPLARRLYLGSLARSIEAVREHYVEMFGITDLPESFSDRPRDCRTDA